jgi:1-acyl-sn-glycerol-3-phosphate acyltransferase
MIQGTERPEPMSPIYWIGWTFYRALYATYFRWRVFNPERVPMRGPVILASNHASFLDPPLIGAGLPRALNYLARESLFDLPIGGWVLRNVNAVPVDRDGAGAAGLRAIFSRLRQGGAILLFPEGTRSRDGELQKARSGVGLVVIKSTAPVVPVRVFGTYAAWNRQMKLPLPVRVAVKYGHPMTFETLRAEARVCAKDRLKEIYQQASNEIMSSIAALKPGEDVARFP